MRKISKHAKAKQTGEIYEAVMERSGGRCEVCSRWFGMVRPVMDHFFKRAKVPQAVSNCWMLCAFCNEDNEANRPTAAHWYGVFIRHATRHGYEKEKALAEAKLYRQETYAKFDADRKGRT